ncbi:HTH-type transcriptional regulator LeuO [Streptomyces jeddahensis]|uniref:HTH-type transcriptional regulator LeuO n=1 Tax=Streptomyces jeddahensis TaxID=1716141 RepID=A0A177HMS1_9ACTN|nr:HTH-type transcriptional regulator LeuO [Streptomyces jeddahensis]
MHSPSSWLHGCRPRLPLPLGDVSKAGPHAESDSKQLPSHADLNLLRTFLAVCRSGSFTAAAPLVGLSQPTVTAQICTLEQQTGRELFTRLPRGVEPTPRAHELAGQIAGPLDALAALEGGSGPLAGHTGHTSPVHLAGPSELLCVRVLPALVPLVADGVQLRVAQGLTEPLLEEMRSGQHDLVIATRRPRGRALASVPLADEEYVLVANPDWARRAADLPGGRRRVRRTPGGPGRHLRGGPAHRAALLADGLRQAAHRPRRGHRAEPVRRAVAAANSRGVWSSRECSHRPCNPHRGHSEVRGHGREGSPSVGPAPWAGM